MDKVYWIFPNVDDYCYNNTIIGSLECRKCKHFKDIINIRRNNQTFTGVKCKQQ